MRGHIPVLLAHSVCIKRLSPPDILNSVSFCDQGLALGTMCLSYHARNDAIASTAESSEEAFRYFRLGPLELTHEKN